MQIFKNIQLIDMAVYLPRSKTLILGDAHIGYEHDLIKKGVFIPKTYFNDMMKRIKKIFSEVEVETVIFNGDIKHEFGSISPQEWSDTLELWNFLEKHSKQIILIRGNHDKTLGPLASKKNLEMSEIAKRKTPRTATQGKQAISDHDQEHASAVLDIKDFFIIDDIFITHGHKLQKIPKAIKTIIIAHEHPAVELSEGGTREKFKCFLVGRHKTKKLIVQPSLFLLTEGTDVLRENLLSPYLKDIDNFEAYVVGDKIYDFGKIRALRKTIL